MAEVPLPLIFSAGLALRDGAAPAAVAREGEAAADLTPVLSPPFAATPRPMAAAAAAAAPSGSF